MPKTKKKDWRKAYDELKKQNAKLKRLLKANEKAARRLDAEEPLPRQRGRPRQRRRYTSDASDPSLEEHTLLRGMKVMNPLTGRDIVVTNFGRHDATVRKVAFQARQERSNDDKYSGALLNMLRQALDRGMDEDAISTEEIPQRIHMAALQHARQAESVPAGGEPSGTEDEGEGWGEDPKTDGQRSARLEKDFYLGDSFRNVARIYRLDMEYLNQEGGGYAQHLHSLENRLTRLMEELVVDEKKTFKVYINYTAAMGKMNPDGGWARKEQSSSKRNRPLSEEAEGSREDGKLKETEKGKEKEKEKENGGSEDGESHFLDSRVVFSSADEMGEIHYIRTAGDAGPASTAMLDRLTHGIEEYQERGSGWRWKASIALEVHVVRYRRDYQGTAGAEVPLPDWLRRRNNVGIFNPRPKPNDDRCLAWCLLRALHPFRAAGGGPMDGATRQAKCRGAVTDLDIAEFVLPDGLSFPIPIDARALKAVEDVNPSLSFSLFHLGSKKDDIRCLYESRFRGERPIHAQVGLVYGKEPDEEGAYPSHAVLLSKGLDTLLFQKRSVVVCERCLTRHLPENYTKHRDECTRLDPTRLLMPAVGGKDQFIQFQSWQNLLPAPFVVYADFEAFLKPVAPEENDRRTEQATNTHEPSAWAYYIRCRYPQHEQAKGAEESPLGQMRSYSGPEPMKHFYESLYEDGRIILGLVGDEQHFFELPEDKEAYESATVCHICERPLAESPDPWKPEKRGSKVLDHDHYTGWYRGAAHNECNTKYSSSKYYKLPVIFHNLKGYDMYHLLRGIGNVVENLEKVECIAKNLDKFTMLNLDHFRFIDSFEFVQGALDEQAKGMARDLQKEPAETLRLFKPLAEHYLRKRGQAWFDRNFGGFLLQKGVYPYEYMKGPEVLEETALPPIEAFRSTLCSGSDISQAEHARAGVAWKEFGCRTLRDYTIEYVELDVLLLASIFEVFRETCLAGDCYGLDPAHYLTAPGLSWSAMLLRNFKGVGRPDGQPFRLENMTDSEMFLMVERGIRGGMCQVMRPRGEANIPGRPEHDPEKPEAKVLYLDACNLYGKAMKEPLPEGGYAWLKKGDPEEPHLWDGHSTQQILEELAVLEWDAPEGLILEVDMEYPVELHDEHNDYPLAPELKRPEPSPFTVEECERIGIKVNRAPRAPRKLVLDLKGKKDYVLHYRNLQLYLQLGMVVTEVKRVIRFRQSAWLSDYVDFNTEKRKRGKNTIETDFFKLMVNSIFGKTMEDVRKRCQIKFFLADKWRNAMRALGTPYAKQFRILVPDQLMVMEQRKHQVVLNRPIILGQAILDISKFVMYNFHYNIMKPYWGAEQCKLLYTDTDSLVYHLTSNDPVLPIDSQLNWMQLRENCFDLSEMPDDHPMLMSWDGSERLDKNANKKVPGKFKDEMSGVEILDFIALRPKMYSLRREDLDGTTGENVEKAKRKGVPKRYAGIRHADYVRVFETGVPVEANFTRFSHDRDTYQLMTVRHRKTALSGCDDKSYWFSNERCLRHGHYAIEAEELNRQILLTGYEDAWPAAPEAAIPFATDPMLGFFLDRGQDYALSCLDESLDDLQLEDVEDMEDVLMEL